MNATPTKPTWCPRCQCNVARPCVCVKDCPDHPTERQYRATERTRIIAESKAKDEAMRLGRIADKRGVIGP